MNLVLLDNLVLWRTLCYGEPCVMENFVLIENRVLRRILCYGELCVDWEPCVTKNLVFGRTRALLENLMLWRTLCWRRTLCYWRTMSYGEPSAMENPMFSDKHWETVLWRTLCCLEPDCWWFNLVFVCRTSFQSVSISSVCVRSTSMELENPVRSPSLSPWVLPQTTVRAALQESTRSTRTNQLT